jgi:hypothetical protein
MIKLQAGSVTSDIPKEQHAKIFLDLTTEPLRVKTNGCVKLYEHSDCRKENQVNPPELEKTVLGISMTL